MKHRPEPGNPPHRKARADAQMFEARHHTTPALLPPQPPRVPPGVQAGLQHSQQPHVQPGPAADGALQDWAVLMDAVKARLLELVGPHGAAPPAQLEPGLALGLHSGVLDCVDALGHLQAMLLSALAQVRHTEQCAVDAQVAWWQASDALTSDAQTRDALTSHPLVDAPADAQADAQADTPPALQDRLTSLPNGRYFRSRLAQALDPARPHDTPLALMALDLDGFDAINEAHGPNVGDALLQIVAARLKRAVRVHDMVGRLGNDTFACLLHGSISPQQLRRLAGKLTDAVAAPMQIGALRLTVRASVGLARCPADAQTVDALLHCAHQARAHARRPTAGPASVDLPDAPDAAGPDWQPGAYNGDDAAPRQSAGSRAAG